MEPAGPECRTSFCSPRYDVFVVLWGKAPAFPSLGITGSLLLRVTVTGGWWWRVSVQEVPSAPAGRVGITKPGKESSPFPQKRFNTLL